MALWRIRATVDDRPGFLAVLAASLALRSVNILAVQVHTTEAGAVDDFLVDAPDSMTNDDLIAAVEKGRGRDAWAVRAQAHGLVDPPTQALALAGRVARDPDTLGEGLRQLLGGDFRSKPSATTVDDALGSGVSSEMVARGGSGDAAGLGGTSVVWRPAGQEPRRYGFAGGRMCLPDPHGGTYEVTRSAPDFTPAEYARAQALVDLAKAAGTRETARTVLLLPDGTELILRVAGPEDLGAVTAMHERCSPDTRRRRYLGGSSGPSPAQLGRLLDQSRATTLVAELADGDGERIVAMANLVGEGVQAEIALLVEDGWQGRGLGTALLRRIGGLAARVGYAALVAYTNAENGAVLRTLDRIGKPSSIEHDGGVLTVTLPLDLPRPGRVGDAEPWRGPKVDEGSLDSRGVPTAAPGAAAGLGTG